MHSRGSTLFKVHELSCTLSCTAKAALTLSTTWLFVIPQRAASEGSSGSEGTRLSSNFRTPTRPTLFQKPAQLSVKRRKSLNAPSVVKVLDAGLSNKDEELMLIQVSLEAQKALYAIIYISVG